MRNDVVQEMVIMVVFRLVCAQLRDQVSLLPVLSRVLHQLPATCQARTVKLLGLLRLLVCGVRIERREAWLSSFITDLVSHLGLASQELCSPSLYILASLCQDNYTVTKLTMSLLPQETLTSMVTSSSGGASDQLTAEILLHSLTTLQLSPLAQPADKLQSLLPKMIDVFCSAYSNDDLPMQTLLITFLTSLTHDSQYKDVLRQQDCLSHTQQLIVISDFSEGFCQESASNLFTFIKCLLTNYSCDTVAMFDICLKLVLSRLDSKPSTSLDTALHLLTTIFTMIDFSIMSDAVARNLKFQVDQLLPSLLSVFVDLSKTGSSGSASKLASGKQGKKVDIDKEGLASCCECLVLLQTIAQVTLDGWTKAVAVGVKSSKMLLAFKTTIEHLKDISSRARLSVEMMTLASKLGDVDSGWRSIQGELTTDKDRVRLLLDLVKMDHVEPGVMKKALTLLSTIENPLEQVEAVESKGDSSVSVSRVQRNDDPELSVETMTRIENMIENVGAAMEKMEIDEVMADVLQLADVRRGHERRQISHLIGALAAADERLANQNLVLLEREDQVRKLERIVSGLVSRLSNSKEELRDIRAQHGDLSREADQTRDRLARELEETRGHVESLSSERDNLAEKVVKFKGKVVELTQDLEQYRENQDQLEKRLKQEIKVKEEVTMTLSKREEKLKKKDRLLEEEMSTREKVEKEVSSLRQPSLIWTAVSGSKDESYYSLKTLSIE